MDQKDINAKYNKYKQKYLNLKQEMIGGGLEHMLEFEALKVLRENKKLEQLVDNDIQQAPNIGTMSSLVSSKSGLYGKPIGNHFSMFSVQHPKHIHKKLLNLLNHGEEDKTICGIHSNMCKLKQILYKYQATPYNGVTGDAYDREAFINDMIGKNIDCGLITNCSFCTEEEKNTDEYRHVKSKCQSHGGDLFAHSQWTALQIISWFNANNPVVEQLDFNTAILCAFFHDIGKGYDCKYDMYSKDKYEGKGDAMHPKYCGDVILGYIKFKLCENNDPTLCSEVNFKDLFNEYFKDVTMNNSSKPVDINIVAITAYMHWELGKINFISKTNDVADLTSKLTEYYCEFYRVCNKKDLGIKNYFNNNNLLYCIAVSLADITASTNNRLRHVLNTHITETHVFNHAEQQKLDELLANKPLNADIISPPLKYTSYPQQIKIAPQTYPSYNPWEMFKMDKRYLKYRLMLINCFDYFSAYINISLTESISHKLVYNLFEET